MTDIVERLAEHTDQAHECGSLGWRDTMNEAAAEIERLRSALEPFAKAADGFDNYNIKNPEEWFAYSGVNTDGERTGSITVGDLHRARAALAEEKQG